MRWGMLLIMTYLIRVQLDQLVVVCLGQGKEGGRHAAVSTCMCDVTHAKEEPHLSNHLATPTLRQQCHYNQQVCVATPLQSAEALTRLCGNIALVSRGTSSWQHEVDSCLSAQI